jgi:glycosyltransferase involved in cell wall biosynthesis
VRIGIDARELCGRATGVGRYLGGLLAEWTAHPDARRHEFILYAHDAIGVPLDARRFALRVVAGHGGTRWEQQQLPPMLDRDHLDVFFAPGYTAPLFSRVPLVVAIHDASFAAHPEWFPAREGLRRRILTRRAAARARAVTTLSEFSKGELMDLLGVPEARIHIIRPGVIRPGMIPPTRNPHADARVLYVGSIFNRRHVPDLIRACGELCRGHRDVSLDLVGDDRSHPREDIAETIARQRANGRIRWHRYISDAELMALYADARAFAFLSEYEGLGLTPLEALAAGVPSVLLDTPIARESCGDAALYVPRSDVSAVTQALERLLFDAGTRQRLLDAAPATLGQYDWPRAARETLGVIEGVL